MLFQIHISATRSGVGILLILGAPKILRGGFALRRMEAVNCLALIGLTPYPGLCRGENDEGNIREMRSEQGETKIPQSRGACGTRIEFCGFYLLSLNILTILSNASDISDKLGWLFIIIMEIYSIRSSPLTSADFMVYFFCCS